MTATTQNESAGDTIPVQLTRMEGDLKLILFQVTDVSRRTGTLEAQMTEQQLEMQQLQSNAAAAEKERISEAKARVETAAALKEQDADRVAKAKAAVDQSASQSAVAWAPRNFAIAFAGLLIAAVVAWVTMKYGGGSNYTPAQ